MPKMKAASWQQNPGPRLPSQAVEQLPSETPIESMHVHAYMFVAECFGTYSICGLTSQ